MRTDRVVMARRRLEMINRIRHLGLLALLVLTAAGSAGRSATTTTPLGRLIQNCSVRRRNHDAR